MRYRAQLASSQARSAERQASSGSFFGNAWNSIQCAALAEDSIGHADAACGHFEAVSQAIERCADRLRITFEKCETKVRNRPRWWPEPLVELGDLYTRKHVVSMVIGPLLFAPGDRGGPLPNSFVRRWCPRHSLEAKRKTCPYAAFPICSYPIRQPIPIKRMPPTSSARRPA